MTTSKKTQSALRATLKQEDASVAERLPAVASAPASTAASAAKKPTNLPAKASRAASENPRASGWATRSAPTKPAAIRPIRSLPTGTRLRVSKISENGEWAEITTDNGTSGWIRAQYLMKEVPAQQRLDELTRKAQVKVLQELSRQLGYASDRFTTEKGRAEDYVCYAAKANSFSIRADGKVQKCTVALDNPLNDIGRIHPDGTLEIDQEKLSRWIFNEKKRCPLQFFALNKLAVAYENAGKFLENPALEPQTETA